MYAVVGFDTYEPVFDVVAYSATIGGGVIMAVLYGVEIYLGRADTATPTAKLAALFSVLCWVTVAAGGRWIGFGG